MFTESHDGSNSDYNQMTIQMTAAGLKEINPAKAGLYMVVAYTATVNSDATPVLGDMGNVNDVKLTWKRTSDDEVKTVEDKAKVYTYGLDIDKKFSGSKKGDATQVEFVLRTRRMATM